MLYYTSDLVELIRSFGLLAHAYADDLQVYFHMNAGSKQVMLQRYSVNVLILLVDGSHGTMDVLESTQA